MQIDSLARQVGERLLAGRHRLVTAESCTGGGIAYFVTAVAGSSQWFDRGWVTYSNESKQRLLNVPGEVLAQHGAVSAETVACMLDGALQHASADVAVAVSGIAGPGGGSEAKPVGTVYIGWHCPGHGAVVERKLFSGDRQAVRLASIGKALQGLLAKL